MILFRHYRMAFTIALSLHLLLAILLTLEHTTKRPVLVNDTKNGATTAPMALEDQKAKAIQAVSVDSKEVMQAMNQLKAQREQQKQAELNRQQALQRQADALRQQRLAEQ